jgi:hypothetical protein
MSTSSLTILSKQPNMIISRLEVKLDFYYGQLSIFGEGPCSSAVQINQERSKLFRIMMPGLLLIDQAHLVKGVAKTGSIA